MKPYLFAVILSGALAGCGLGETEPAGPSVSLECSQDVKDTVIATNNCDKSTRTAEPFVVQPFVVETAPAE